MAISILAAACSGGNDLVDHADGKGPLRFAPGTNVRTTFTAKTLTAVLIGGFPVYNEGSEPITLEAIDAKPSGSCPVIPVQLREPFDRGLTGTSTKPREAVGAFLLDEDRTIVVGDAAALIFEVDGTQCAEGQNSEYGPVVVTYRHGAFPLQTEFGFYFEIEW